MRKLLLLALGSIALLRADTTPSLTWTGDPTPSSGASGLFDSSATPTGFEVDVNCSAGGDCGVSFGVSRDFTVTSPGAFILSTNIALGGEAFNCYPSRCSPVAYLSISYNGFADNAGLALTGSASSTVGPTDPSNGISCLEAGSDCIAFVNLSSASSQIVNLGPGASELDETYNVTGTSGTGDTIVGGTFDFSLVPTPEPRYSFLFLAVAFILLACLRGKIRPTQN
jgi:hypothetical protein